MCDIERISISNNINKSDVMDWMTTYQDVRRNMCEAERIYANDKVSARRIEEENEKKRLAGTYNSHKTRGNNENDGCVHLDASKKQNETVPRTLVNNVQKLLVLELD